MQKMAFANCISVKIEMNYLISVILKKKYMSFCILKTRTACRKMHYFVKHVLVYSFIMREKSQHRCLAKALFKI